MRDRTYDFDQFCDDLGPAKIVHIYEPDSNLKAIVVIDNTAAGPAIGGVRMAPDVSSQEVFRLARAMTQKNAAAGLPHGGGKSGIIADPKKSGKRQLIRAFARAIRDLTDYIPGPDMGTDETCMAWIRNEIGRAVGLPRVLGGIPLDEIGATGYGIAQCAEVAAPLCNLDLHGATVAIEGFGNVGRNAARFLAGKGVRLVAASDSQGAVHDPSGIDVEELRAVKRKSGSVIHYVGGNQLAIEELFGVDCDILVPAARPDCIHEKNVADIKAKLILQGANIPATATAERLLHEQGVLVVPDFIANAGGVICAAVEFHGGLERDALEVIADKIQANTKQVLARAGEEKILPREAAVELARERILAAMKLRN